MSQPKFIQDLFLVDKAITKQGLTVESSAFRLLMHSVLGTRALVSALKDARITDQEITTGNRKGQ